MTSRLQARLLAQRALFQRLQSSKKRSKRQAGFTLIELLIVVIIIGILAAIALPSFLNQRDRAYFASAKSWASSEARKCAASWAATDSEVDFTGTAPPSPLGNVTPSPTTAAASTTECGNVDAGGAVWSATYNGVTASYTVNEGGSVTATES